MTFGQQSGPPATARQLQQLTALLEAAGHTDFRDARGPLGLTQRQAGGRFTRDEADALISRLQDDLGDDDAPSTHGVVDLRAVPPETLAAELQRRGWVVMEP